MIPLKEESRKREARLETDPKVKAATEKESRTPPTEIVLLKAKVEKPEKESQVTAVEPTPKPATLATSVASPRPVRLDRDFVSTTSEASATKEIPATFIMRKHAATGARARANEVTNALTSTTTIKLSLPTAGQTARVYRTRGAMHRTKPWLHCRWTSEAALSHKTAPLPVAGAPPFLDELPHSTPNGCSLKDVTLDVGGTT